MSRASIRAALRPIGQHSRQQIPAIRLAARARGYASESSGSNNSQSLLLGGLALAGAGAAYYAYSGNSTDGHLQAGYSSKPKDAASPKVVDYQKVYNAIADVLDAGDEEYDDGSFGPVLIRLAWHASGTYDKASGNGGSNGATMRFAPEANHGANAGLIHARERIEKVKQQFPEMTVRALFFGMSS